ncbi:DEAD/DEAH box helicase, putative [Eimeria mitis]|uniref:DEAD/DEAH box helicase, putative n=1 Tax=Eimeria mitis TaxID=44415 RepID=U6K573_9EIME|nr:DEAD/DEAH box helicase, putative [Eimeria mitis]CDJ32885.1 DEAD/DEAH box helicase, putative [Eimeria mitis]
MRFLVQVLIYLGLSRLGLCFFLRTSEDLGKSQLYKDPGVNSSAWIPSTPPCRIVWSHYRHEASGRNLHQRSWLTSRWRGYLFNPGASLATVCYSRLNSLPSQAEGHQPLPSGAGSSAAQQPLRPDPVQQKAEEVSRTSPSENSAGGTGDIQEVEIDATLDGISREGLLQLLQELKQQTPELIRLLPSPNTSDLENLSTEQLRGLVERLLNLAEAADAHEGVDPVSVGAEELSTTVSRGEVKPQHAQPFPEPQPLKQKEDSKYKQKREKQRARKHEHEDRQQQHSGANVQPSQRALAQADAAAAAATSAAAVEAQQLLEIGSSEEEGEGLFSALQEQLPVMPEVDVLDLLVTMGPVLLALLPPESPPQELSLRGQQNQQQDSAVDSVGALLDATTAERKALAAEAAVIREFVEAKVRHLSLEAKKDLLLTLLAVAEVEAYSPKEPEVCQLLGLHGPRAGVLPSASAAAAAAAENVGEQTENVGFGGLPVVSAWRRLLQLPENALRGESPLSAAEAEALSAEEVKLRYLRVIQQARQESIKASLKRCNYMEEPEGSEEGPKDQPLPTESLRDNSTSQGILEGKQPTKADSEKPKVSEDPQHSLRHVTGSDCLDHRVDVGDSAPAKATTVDAAVEVPFKPKSSASESPGAAKRHDKKPAAAESPSIVVPTASVGIPISKNDAAFQSRHDGDQQVEKEELLDPSRKPKIVLKDKPAAGDSEGTSGGSRPADLTAGAGRFAALGLNNVVSSAAAAFLGGTAPRPTPTQQRVVPHILEAFKRAERKSRSSMADRLPVDSLVALRAHTGSGKTLAYLLPLMQTLREQETAAAAAEKRRAREEAEYTDLMDCKALEENLGGHGGSHRAIFGARGPRALVVCPSRPLAAQVASAAAALAKRIRLSVGCTTGGVGTGDQLRLLRRRLVDILIGTPDRLLRLTRPNPVESRTSGTGERNDSTQRTIWGLPSLESVQFCILDEADASWLGGFRAEVEKLLIRSHFLPAGSQQKGEQESIGARPKVLLTCTATPNSGIEADLCELLELPAERILTVSGGPSFPPQTQLRHEMMQAGGTDRFLLLVEQIKIHPELRAKKILIFCNTVDSCRACCHHLQAADLPAEGYDGSLPASVREKNLRLFQEGSGQRILVATDAVARGIHIGGVDVVVNADFPLTTVEYLHRAGRTGRVDSKGFVLSFVSKKDAAVAAAVRASLSAGLSVEGIDERVPRPKSPSGYRSTKIRQAKPKSKARRGGWKPPRSKEWHAARMERMERAKRLKEKRRGKDYPKGRRLGRY